MIHEPVIYHLIDCKLNSLRFCSYFYFCNILLSNIRIPFQVWNPQPNRRSFYKRSKEFDLQQTLEGRFNELEKGLQFLSERPFFAKVNNRSSVKVGETAFLPCRVKFIQQGYMVSTVTYPYTQICISILILFSTVGRILGNYKSVLVPRLTFFSDEFLETFLKYIGRFFILYLLIKHATFIDILSTIKSLYQ